MVRATIPAATGVVHVRAPVTSRLTFLMGHDVDDGVSVTIPWPGPFQLLDYGAVSLPSPTKQDGCQNHCQSLHQSSFHLLAENGCCHCQSLQLGCVEP